MVLKVITVLVGAFLLLQSMGWILDPSAAAAGLGMTIVEGVGANTQIGAVSYTHLTLPTILLV